MATSRRYPIGCTLGLILGGLACQALAEPPAAPNSNDLGIMTFPNVRVIHAPPAAEQKPVAAASSMKAFIDPLTGELREATAQDVEQLSNTTSARTLTGTLATGGATTASTDEVEQLYGPNNIVGLQLTDADMVFQMAHIDADGNVSQQCVTGENEAAHALHSHAVKDQIQQESQNDR